MSVDEEGGEKEGEKRVETQGKEEDYHRSDEQVSVCLQAFQSQLQQVKRRYIRCVANMLACFIHYFFSGNLQYTKVQNNKM